MLGEKSRRDRSSLPKGLTLLFRNQTQVTRALTTPPHSPALTDYNFHTVTAVPSPLFPLKTQTQSVLFLSPAALQTLQSGSGLEWKTRLARLLQDQCSSAPPLPACPHTSSMHAPSHLILLQGLCSSSLNPSQHHPIILQCPCRQHRSCHQAWVRTCPIWEALRFQQRQNPVVQAFSPHQWA